MSNEKCETCEHWRDYRCRLGTLPGYTICSREYKRRETAVVELRW